MSMRPRTARTRLPISLPFAMSRTRPSRSKGRKWVVTDSNGHRIVVEGDGVVGQFPRLRCGEQFSYNSHHVIGSDSYAEGAYIGVTDGEHSQ